MAFPLASAELQWRRWAGWASSQLFCGIANRSRQVHAQILAVSMEYVLALLFGQQGPGRPPHWGCSYEWEGQRESSCMLLKGTFTVSMGTVSIGLCAQSGTTEPEAGASFPGRTCPASAKNTNPFNANSPSNLLKGNFFP